MCSLVARRIPSPADRALLGSDVFVGSVVGKGLAGASCGHAPCLGASLDDLFTVCGHWPSAHIFPVVGLVCPPRCALMEIEGLVSLDKWADPPRSLFLLLGKLSPCPTEQMWAPSPVGQPCVPEGCEVLDERLLVAPDGPFTQNQMAIFNGRPTIW